VVFQRRRAIACRTWTIALAGFLLVGCNLAPRGSEGPPYVAGYPQEQYPRVEQCSVAALAASLGPLGKADEPPTQPLNILTVCASGASSPFTAGAVVGWTQSGNRPTFDVVAGTSSGAIVGAFAFLGPKYDPTLEKLATNTTTADLFHIRPLLYLLRDGAIASSRPLERLLETEINEAFLADLRDAHAQGRRLFIGTTNFDTKRLVIWDLGAIASSGRSDAAVLVRKILLATATWPGLLPAVEIPVHINGERRLEQHIDGGAAAQSFVQFGPTLGWPGADEPAPGWLAGSNLYVLAGGKLYPDPTPAPREFFGRILTGVSCLTNSLARADMHRWHALCLSSGMRFNLLALPNDYRSSEQSIWELDKAEMRRLFDAGHRLTSTGPVWRHTPPGAEPDEETIPRGALADATAP
jgi:hypothetical protein